MSHMPVSAESTSSLPIDPAVRAQLERWVRAPTTPQRTVRRSRIVLLLAEGFSARAVARKVGVSRNTVELWRARYAKEGAETLTCDRPGRGRKPCSEGASA
jgi:DNA-binding NarL/FixJ family response regulator